MSKTITMSVPDELHEKMGKWKDSFNFSKVFQEAISDRIQRKEGFQKRLKEVTKDMSETIERLKKEKEESEKESFDLGKSEGLEWAKSAHYDEIQFVAKKPNDFYSEVSSLEIVKQLNYSYDDYFQEALEEIYGNNVEPWCNGWIEGVCEFWDEIQDKL